MEKILSILVVEDEPFMRLLLSEYLEPEGYVVTLAENGLQAWQILQKVNQSFDLIITDRNMPSMDGLELLQHIKREPRLKDLPIIFQTASSSIEHVLEGVRAGVYYYLTKPYDPELLLTMISVAIENSRQHKQLHETARHLQTTIDLLSIAEFSFRTLDDTQRLAPLLAQFCPEPDRVITGLSELLVNAVEHGNLGICYEKKGALVASGQWLDEVEWLLQQPEMLEKYAHAKIERNTKVVVITITDQGEGFDPTQYLDFKPECMTHFHGRGIALSRLLSFDYLEYVGQGNQVRVEVHVH